MGLKLNDILGIGAGLLGLGGAAADDSARKKQLELAQRQRQQSLDFINQQLQQGRSDLFNFFPQAQQSRQMGQEASLNALGQSFGGQLNAFQDGNVMAQQALLAGLPQMNNALLGGKLDLSMLQPQRVNVNEQALSGLFNPEALKFAPMQGM